jgi:single-strand DNA-binding protein
MNTVSLIGRFARDPELKYTQSGTAICNFTLAVRNPFSKENEADFIRCVAWGNVAELVAEKHEKGNMIGVEGRIATRSYENNEGNKVFVTEVNINSIHFIQTRDYDDNGNGNGNGNRNGNRNQNTRNQNTRNRK